MTPRSRGVRRLVGARRHLVADRQEGQVRAVELDDQLHVAEDTGVPGVVELEAALELDDVAQRLAAVDQAAVVEGDGRGVEGVGRCHLDAADLTRSALLDRHRVLHALALEVGEDLEVGDRRCACLSLQRQHV
jgi:hypothetical protein